ncbi:MAG: hypothetical protein ACK5NN_02085 [Sphingomonadaceae bacterium]
MIRANLVRFVQALRDGRRIWWLAPMVPMLAVVPEAIQHIAEIHIGFFESREMAIDLSYDPRRMVWGILKVIGLFLAIFASLRFWATRTQGLAQGQAWYSLRGIRWGALGLSFILIGLVGVPEWSLKGRISAEAGQALTIGLTIATLPLMTMFTGALIGDGAMDLRRAFRKGWWPALRMILFAAATWAPLSWLHGRNHDWAMGASTPVVWALMAFDALVVGMIAVMAGTAFHHGYALADEPRD